MKLEERIKHIKQIQDIKDALWELLAKLRGEKLGPGGIDVTGVRYAKQAIKRALSELSLARAILGDPSYCDTSPTKDDEE